MLHRPLGQSGIKASVVGFGAWAIGGWMWGGTDKAAAIKAIQAAIDAGTNLIDTAPIYGFGLSEEIVGEAIRGRRDRVVLATKCGLVWNVERGDHFFNSDDEHPTAKSANRKVYRYLGPESIRLEVEQSLKRMKVDVIDLYQTHWQETKTPIADTMAELLRLKKAGKIRAIGVSNATVAQINEYRTVGSVDADQERYSMLDRGCDKDLLPFCAEENIAFLAYSPLGQGLLTGRIGPDRTFSKGDQRIANPRFSVESRAKIAAMLAQFKPVADRHHATLGQLVVAWTLAQRGCSHALCGARTPEQAVENAKAGDIKLTRGDLEVMAKVIDSFAG